MYTRPSLKETDIIHRTAMTTAIREKHSHLIEINTDIIKVITTDPIACIVDTINCMQGIISLISGIFDGWSRRGRKSFNSFSIAWVHSSPDKPNIWSLKTMLLCFDRIHGRHTGEGMGKLLVKEIKKYGFQDRVCY
jgi:hypothetical protein